MRVKEEKAENIVGEAVFLQTMAFETTLCFPIFFFPHPEENQCDERHR